MKKQSTTTVLAISVLSDIVFLFIAFAAGDNIRYYVDSSYRALVDFAKVFFIIGIIINIVWIVIIQNSKPKPQTITKCPSCGASVSMFSDVCWKCHQPLKEGIVQPSFTQSPKEEAGNKTPAKPEQTPFKPILENEATPENVDENQVIEVYFAGLAISTAKIKVIQLVREVVGLSLADAKQFVENPPSLLKSTTSMEEAEQIKGLLESVGATVEFKVKL